MLRHDNEARAYAQHDPRLAADFQSTFGIDFVHICFIRSQEEGGIPKATRFRNMLEGIQLAGSQMD